jgi:hypothetical protein
MMTHQACPGSVLCGRTDNKNIQQIHVISQHSDTYFLQMLTRIRYSPNIREHFNELLRGEKTMVRWRVFDTRDKYELYLLFKCTIKYRHELRIQDPRLLREKLIKFNQVKLAVSMIHLLQNDKWFLKENHVLGWSSNPRVGKGKQTKGDDLWIRTASRCRGILLTRPVQESEAGCYKVGWSAHLPLLRRHWHSPII